MSAEGRLGRTPAGIRLILARSRNACAIRIAARIAELIHRFDEADLVLADTLADTITREDLGFAPEPEPAEGQAADERDE